MRCQGFALEDYSQFALGADEGAVRDEIAHHLVVGCETCLDELKKANELWGRVALAVPQSNPPRSVRRRVVALTAPNRTGLTAWLWPALAGAAAAGLVAIGIGSFPGAQRTPEPVPVAVMTPGPALPIPSTPAPTALPTPAAQPAVTATTVPASVADALQRELDTERASVQTLQAEIDRQTRLVAAAQANAKDAEDRYASLRSADADRATVERRLALASARNTELERQVTEYRTLLADQRKVSDHYVQLAGLMTSPSLKVVQLKPTEQNRGMEGHALMADGSRMMFFGSQLPALPAGRTFQLWILRGRAPAIASAGTFRPDQSNRAVLEFANPTLLAGATALAVTDEPAGGSVLPTGHEWLVGSQL